MGGHLVTVAESEEQTFVAATGLSAFWSGARAPIGGRYEWTTGEPFVYQAFAPGEAAPPHAGACAAFGVDELWHPRPCESALAYMCEVD
jgi:hypothetical protein